MSWNAIVGITRSKVIMMVGLTMMCWLQLNINSINHCKPWHCHLAVLKRFRVEPELIDFRSAYCWDLVICPPSFEHPPGQLWAMCMCWNLVPSVPIRNVNSIVCLGMLINYFWGFFWYRYQLGTDPYWYQFISHGVASCCTQFNQILLYTQYPSFGHLIAIKHYNDWIVIGFDWSFLISIWYYMYFFTDIHYVFDLYLYIIIIHPREDRICKCHTLNIWGSIFIYWK